MFHSECHKQSVKQQQLDYSLLLLCYYIVQSLDWSSSKILSSVKPKQDQEKMLLTLWPGWHPSKVAWVPKPISSTVKLQQHRDQGKNVRPSGVRCRLTGLTSVSSSGSQDLSHVMGSSGMITGGAGGQEITLTINNSSLTQAFASASCSSGAAANPQEITLTISGVCTVVFTRCMSI